MPIQISGPHSHRRSASAVAALALLLGPFATSFADSLPSEQLPRVTVKYGELNLSTPAGADRLLHRIEAGARQVCGDPVGTKDLSEWLRFRRCYSQTVARAVEDVQAQRLTEAYRASHSIALAK